MALELEDVAEAIPKLVLYAFYSGATGKMSFSAFKEELPLELVEWFVAEAKSRLPPSENNLPTA